MRKVQAQSQGGVEFEIIGNDAIRYGFTPGQDIRPQPGQIDGAVDAVSVPARDWLAGNDPLSKLLRWIRDMFTGRDKAAVVDPEPSEPVANSKVGIDTNGDGAVDMYVDPRDLLDKESDLWDQLRNQGIDTVGIDTDGDGIMDHLVDPNNLPAADSPVWLDLLKKADPLPIGVDTDGDGVPDVFPDLRELQDPNSAFWQDLRDRGIDQVMIDTNGDGVADTAVDPNNVPESTDPFWDSLWAEQDPKLAGVDVDGDGVIDYFVDVDRLTNWRGIWNRIFGSGKTGVDTDNDGIVDTFFAGMRGPGFEGVMQLIGLQILDIVSFLSVLFSAFFIAGGLYYRSKIEYWRAKEEEKFEYVPIAKVEAEENKRWTQIKGWSESDNENDWRRAIIDADIMLDDMLGGMGYLASDVGGKLKQVETSDFPVLNLAWEAHKVRNTIAHEGESYYLTRKETKRVMDLYEIVFKEFSYI